MTDFMAWRNAPTATAVAQVLESLVPGRVIQARLDPQKSILVASYAEDFDYLWTYPKTFAEWSATSERHVVLVWDGSPDFGRLGQYNISEYLTPMDWSVMITLEAKQVPRITIVDFHSQHQRGARTVQLFRHLRRMDPSPLQHVSETNLARLRQFFSVIANDVLPIQPGPEDRCMLRSVWNSALIEGRGTHHSIANIVGPLLLLESMGRAAPNARSPIANALRQLIRVLHQPDSQTADNASMRNGDSEPWFDFLRNFGQWVDSVVLIDDLADNGWADVLRAMLGLGMGDDRLRVYQRPQIDDRADGSVGLDVPGYLRRRLDWLRSGRRFGQGSLAPGLQNPLLFLDIRLFSQSSLRYERKFYTELLALARQFAAFPASAWPVDLSDHALAAVERFANGHSDLESPDHHAALSLLPRLLALADPTLPIVLFSSTGRRAIVEPLISCGNVIFDFEKPRLADRDWDEALDRTKISFRHAMERITPLFKARSFLLHVRQEASRTKQLRRSAEGTNSTWAEVYLDESGQDQFSVGGVVLFYPSYQGRDDLDQMLKEQELVWGLAEGHRPSDASDTIPSRYIPKYPGGPGWHPDGYNRYLERLNKCFKDLHVKQVAFALVWVPETKETSTGLPDLLREEVIDNRYRRMIEEALEAVLYCLLPAYGAADAQVSVECATRVRPPETPYNLEQLRNDFGIVSNVVSGKYYVLSGDSVYPIVGRLLASRSGAPPKVRRARGTTLSDYQDLLNKSPRDYRKIVNDPFRARPRQLHYLADWFARFALHDIDLPKTPLVARAFKAGFLEKRGDRFASWLRASRAGAEGRFSDALVETWMASRQTEPEWSLARWLWHAAAQWGEMLDGPGFLQFAMRISGLTANAKQAELQPVSLN